MEAAGRPYACTYTTDVPRRMTAGLCCRVPRAAWQMEAAGRRYPGFGFDFDFRFCPAGLTGRALLRS